MLTRLQAQQRGQLDSSMQGDVEQAMEIIPQQLYFLKECKSDKWSAKEEELNNHLNCSVHEHPTATRIHWFSLDETFEYQPFFKDFGPLHLAHLYQFCRLVDSKLLVNSTIKSSSSSSCVCTIFHTPNNPQDQANGAYLIAAYLIINHNYTAAEAWQRIAAGAPYAPFRDASKAGYVNFPLNVIDVLEAVERARDLKFFDFDTFDDAEYQWFERVQNGDLNIIVPNLFMAFAGPLNTQWTDGWRTFTPTDYIPIFKQFNVSTVIRLNRKCYDKTDFTRNGFKHHDFFFVDGTIPSKQIVNDFIKTCEQAPLGVIAVHCKAGLGRTGTTIGCYLMKHFDLTARQAIAWIRICRPGSVIGCQQDFLVEMEPEMRALGKEFRAKHNIQLPWEQQQQQPANDGDDERPLPAQSFLSAHIQAKAAIRRRRSSSGRRRRSKSKTKRKPLVVDPSESSGSAEADLSQGDELNRRKAQQARNTPTRKSSHT